MLSAKNEEHRDYWRRQHRILAFYLSHEGWIRGLDCIVLEREHLMKFLELRRFKAAHIDWLLADVEPWFPYVYPLYITKRVDSIHSIYFSRLELKSTAFDVHMMTIDRISVWPKDQPKTAMLISGSDEEFPDEATAISRLARLVAGLIEPK